MQNDEPAQLLEAARPEPQWAAFVAIDWADKRHYWSWCDGDGQSKRGVLENTPEAVEAWVMELRQRWNNRPIAVALEQRKGALQVMLGKYEQLYLYPVHPLTVARYREAWYPSGSKDDVKDADLLLEILTRHRERLRRIDPDTVEMRELQALVENRRKLVDERTAISNKLKDTLKVCFPQIPVWFDDVTTEIVGELLLRWPTLEELKKARPATLEKFFKEHGARGEERIQERIKAIGQAVPATQDRAVIQPAQLMIAAWAGQLSVLRDAIRGIEKAIRDSATVQPDWEIFQSFPGAGEVMAPRLMAALGTQRNRFASANELQSFAGIAPVKEASGNTIVVHIRFGCPKFLRQTFHEWAACSIPQCPWAKAHYDSLKARGKSHHMAIRALAFKWLRILFRCWQQRQPYCEQTYLDSLGKRNLQFSRLVESVKMP